MKRRPKVILTVDLIKLSAASVKKRREFVAMVAEAIGVEMPRNRRAKR